MKKNLLGWSESWDSQLVAGLYPARIISVQKNRYKAISESGEIICQLSGKFHHLSLQDSSEFPAVGDWVLVTPEFINESGESSALIEKILERKSRIARLGAGSKLEKQVLAANVDFVFIVTSVNADLNIKRLQRYLLLAEEGGVDPLIILSKCDLNKNVESTLKSLSDAFPSVKTIPTSSETGLGKSELRKIAKQTTTSVFVGSSGVGKSTLVNSLLQSSQQLTQSIRENDDKGRHTTTSRELFFLNEGGMIIDTPGLREIQVFGNEESAKSVFPELNRLMESCKFSDCSHTNEPGCAVKKGIESGVISQSDLASYEKLQREMAHANRKLDKQLASNSKKKWKQIHLDYKARKKLEGR